MTNEKRELFATLGLIAEESVANESVSTELEPEVELTALESIESELKDLDEIERCQDEAEKASFESMISDLELLNSVLAYKSVKTAGAEEAALESISAEFGISTEGIKDLAEKGINAVKALIDKIIKALKGLFGASKTQEKVIKSLEYKVKNANTDGKYDVKEFAKILGIEMILGGMMNYGYHEKDFPSATMFQEVKGIADLAVEKFYKNKLDRNNIVHSLSGDVNHITKGISDVEAAAAKVEDSQNFDYHIGAVRLIACFKAYNVGKYISELITVLEEHKATLAKGGKIEFDSKITSEELTNTLKTVNKLKEINSSNVRALVKLCGQYLKYAKPAKPAEEKSA